MLMLVGEIDFGVLSHSKALICVVLVVPHIWPKSNILLVSKVSWQNFHQRRKNILSLDKCCWLNTSYLQHTSCRSEHIDRINELNSVLLTSAPVDGKKKTLELVVLHSSFDLLKKYAKTLTFKEVLSYSWRPINQSKSVFVWTCNVSFIISSGMLWKIDTNTLRLKHWLKSLWPQGYQHIRTWDVIMIFCLKRRGTHICALISRLSS